MPTTYTPNYQLAKPPFDDIPWDQAVNGNMDKIDALLAQYLSIANFAGVWQNNATYAVGQVLIDAQDSTMWRCLVVHTSAVTPSTFAQDRTARPTLWTPMTAAVTTPPIGAVNIGRNLIHNSMFNITQRGAGPFTGNGVYTADRWLFNFDTDTASVVPYAISDGDRASIGDEAATNALGVIFTGVSGAAALTLLCQRIEGTRRMAGKIVTVSFWVKRNSGTATNIGVSFDQTFGGGGSPSANVLGAGFAFPLSSVWQHFSLSLAIPSAIGETFGTTVGSDWSQLVFWFSSGGVNSAIRSGNIGVQSGNVALWGVQLEIGSAATPLEKPDPRYDLSNCQRFFHYGFFASVGYATTGDFVGAAYTFPVTMRGIPTVTIGAPVAADVGVSTAATDMTNQLGFRYSFTSTITGVIQGSRYFTASADL